MAVRAGQLRHRVGFRVITRTANGRGGFTESLGAVVTLWAEIKPVLKMEVWENEQLRGSIDHQIKIRFTDDVSSFLTKRAEFRGRTFEIISFADNVEKNEFITMLAKEIPASG